MGYVEGTNRSQMVMMSYDDFVGENNIVRVIDRFIEVCDLDKMGFNRTTPAATGRPAYSPQDMAKLYIYGYENGVRSSLQVVGLDRW